MQVKIVAVWIALGFATLAQVAKQHVEVQRGKHEAINYGNFKGFLNHTLNVSQVLASIYVQDFFDCAFRCIATFGCFSFNIAIVHSINPNNHVCHLLATDKYNHSSNFVPNYYKNSIQGFLPYAETRPMSYKNCLERYKAGERISGVYAINPDNIGAFDVYCDQTTDGGGWTVFQKRLDGSVDFDRGWNDYKRGFGDLNGEFWLGLDKIHCLTKERSTLRVDLEDFENQKAYAEYDFFGVSDEGGKYNLSLGKYSGTAGDSFSYHRGMAFSTKDRDNDRDSGVNYCAPQWKGGGGGWWFKACHNAFLNGVYYHGKHSNTWGGVVWAKWKGSSYSAKTAEMKIKPISV